VCTAITLKTSENHHLVGRNFDIHPMNDLSVALVPREFEYVNRVTNEEMKTKYAVLGMGLFYENHILFCDGVNEKGLSCLMLQLSKFSTWSHKIRIRSI
jgi:choloylglycine hydrolase